MSQAHWEGYLSLLRDLTKLLEQLAQVELDKGKAVKADDIATLNELMKQEQALSLSLRGLEGKREKTVAALGLEGSRLSSLASACPPPLQEEARAVEGALRRQYQLYRGAADLARTTLECNLHEIEKLLDGQEGAGYAGRVQPELPQSLKTDFRA